MTFYGQCPQGHITDRPPLIPGVVVIRCRECRKLSVEGSTLWLNMGDGVIGQLRTIAGQVAEEKARHKYFMESDITDPIWTDISNG